METRGPWATKSGGTLNVLFSLPWEMLQKNYLHYDSEELDRVPGDIRGLRIYTVTRLAKGRIGGNEWHRVREEMVFAQRGTFRWTCEDLLGRTQEFTLDAGHGIWMPPYILHEYEALEDDSALLVVANTLFDPNIAATQDSYPAESFRNLQREIAEL